MIKRDFLSITNISSKELLSILSLAKKIKKELKEKGKNTPLFTQRTLAMIFEKPSLRTRISFEAGMTQLGGHAIYLGQNDIGLGVRESISDSATVISRMTDIIMARTFKHETVMELAQYSKVPVINALSDLEHPCQTLADLLTIWEIKKTLKGLKISFIGDGNNNVTHSLCLAAAMLGIDFSCASPKGYQMHKSIVKQTESFAAKTGAKIIQTNDPYEAAKKADVIYTDTWVSMGLEKEKQERLKIFKPYQVTQKVMNKAKDDAIFMHDMPAYRENEVATEVIDGPQSVIFQQAENRLHAQKALMVFLLKRA